MEIFVHCGCVWYSEEDKTLRILVFSGDDDSVCATRGTQLWIDRLNWTPIQDWTPWTVDHQVAGYKKKFENDFTFATVRAAGHEVRHRPAAVAKEDRSGMSLRRGRADALVVHVLVVAGACVQARGRPAAVRRLP